MNSIRKLAGPGLFRLALATLVFVHHVSRYALGAAAVYIFFSLSGYWIYRMWRFRYSTTVHPYLTYLVSRVWRLVPTFVLINVITIATEYALGSSAEKLRGAADWPQFLFSQVFILGYDTLPFQPLVPAWSLDFEMQFYLLAPFLITITVIASQPQRWLLLGFAALLSLGSALWLGSAVLTSYLVFFLAGILAANANWRPSGKLAAYSSVLGLALLFACLLSPFRGILLIGTHSGPLSIYNQHVNVLFALLVIPYAIYTTRQVGFKLDGAFADLSYIVYLLHWTAVLCLGLNRQLHVSRALFTALCFVAVYGLAAAIWKFYDRPINESRSKWVATRKLPIRQPVQAIEQEPAAP